MISLIDAQRELLEESNMSSASVFRLSFILDTLITLVRSCLSSSSSSRPTNSPIPDSDFSPVSSEADVSSS